MSTLHHGRAAGSTCRIGINAHLLSTAGGYRRAGIHHYIAEVLRNLPPGESTEYVVYGRELEEAGMENTAVRLAGTRWPTEKRLVRILWEQTAWPLAIARDRLDLLHSMAFVTPIVNRVPEIVTIYDLSFFKYPEMFPGSQRAYLQGQTARSARGAARVITISASSRDDVQALFGVPASAIDIVYPGVDPRYRPLPAAEVAAFQAQETLPEQVLLHVGTLQPRKNVPALLEALARLGRPEVLLVLIGGKGWMYEEIYALVERLNLREQVRFAGYVADEALPLWYNAAKALVFPSVYEGFGLPVVEALACGTAVVAANASSIPEAGGEAALYFEPHDVAGLASQLARVLDGEADLARRRAAGLAQARQFSWARAGQETAAAYRRVLAGS